MDDAVSAGCASRTQIQNPGTAEKDDRNVGGGDGDRSQIGGPGDAGVPVRGRRCDVRVVHLTWAHSVPGRGPDAQVQVAYCTDAGHWKHTLFCPVCPDTRACTHGAGRVAPGARDPESSPIVSCCL